MMTKSMIYLIVMKGKLKEVSNNVINIQVSLLNRKKDLLQLPIRNK